MRLTTDMNGVGHQCLCPQPPSCICLFDLPAARLTFSHLRPFILSIHPTCLYEYHHALSIPCATSFDDLPPNSDLPCTTSILSATSQITARLQIDWPRREMPSRHYLAITSFSYLSALLIGTDGHERATTARHGYMVTRLGRYSAAR